MNTFYLRIISLGEIKPTGGRIEKTHYEHTSEISFQYQAADLFTSLIDKLFQLKHENPEMEYHIVWTLWWDLGATTHWSQSLSDSANIFLTLFNRVN
jgi:hypothetical protein